MKQTAVDWLVDQVEDFIALIPTDIIEKAKQMEKEQIENSFNIGNLDGYNYGCNDDIPLYEDGEQYYQKTYEENA